MKSLLRLIYFSLLCYSILYALTVVVDFVTYWSGDSLPDLSIFAIAFGRISSAAMFGILALICWLLSKSSEPDHLHSNKPEPEKSFELLEHPHEAVPRLQVRNAVRRFCANYGRFFLVFSIVYGASSTWTLITQFTDKKSALLSSTHMFLIRVSTPLCLIALICICYLVDRLTRSAR